MGGGRRFGKRRGRGSVSRIISRLCGGRSIIGCRILSRMRRVGGLRTGKGSWRGWILVSRRGTNKCWLGVGKIIKVWSRMDVPGVGCPCPEQFWWLLINNSIKSAKIYITTTKDY